MEPGSSIIENLRSAVTAAVRTREPDFIRDQVSNVEIPARQVLIPIVGNENGEGKMSDPVQVLDRIAAQIRWLETEIADYERQSVSTTRNGNAYLKFLRTSLDQFERLSV
jgi:hypothetical protein